jgi:hypothetical protein
MITTCSVELGHEKRRGQYDMKCKERGQISVSSPLLLRIFLA